jgi:hypothetical protein
MMQQSWDRNRQKTCFMPWHKDPARVSCGLRYRSPDEGRRAGKGAERASWRCGREKLLRERNGA